MMKHQVWPRVGNSGRGEPSGRSSRGYAGRGARGVLRAFVALFLFVISVLGRAAPSFAEDRREIHVTVRPRSIAADVDRWAYYPGTGLTIFGDKKDFEKATNNLIIFVYDKDADPQGNCTLKEILDRRGDAVRLDPHQPEGGLARCSGSGRKAGDRPKGWDAAAGRALAGVGAAANLSSPEGEQGGSPLGIAGGMNPDAESSPGKQAAAAGVQIFMAATDIEQIVRVATRFVAAKFTSKAEVAAIEAAAREAAEKVAREQGEKVSREAVEKAAREAADDAGRSLARGGAGAGAPGQLKVVHIPRHGEPPPLRGSGTPIRTNGEAAAMKAGRQAHTYTPERALPVDKQNVPIPDVDVPHTQLGRSRPKFGSEPQAREWGYGSNGKLQPKRDIDFSDHGHPDAHPNPHQHELTPNNPDLAPKGGYQRGKPKSL